jgi:hypothetical protein
MTQNNNSETLSMAPSKYRWQDRLIVDIARYYSERYDKPFYAAIGKFEDYDIISIDKQLSVECKCESSPSRTGNICLEYWNTDFNKPSGVLSTQASLWLHIVYYDGTYTGYECSVDDVRKLVIEQGVIKSNGKNSLFKIIPLEVFKKIAKQSFIIQKDSPGCRKPDIAGVIVPE